VVDVFVLLSGHRQYFIAKSDALVANVLLRARYKYFHLLLRAAAKRAFDRFFLYTLVSVTGKIFVAEFYAVGANVTRRSVNKPAHVFSELEAKTTVHGISVFF